MILNDNEKLTILSPKFHPDQDGLGAFSTLFSLKLGKVFNINLVTGSGKRLPEDSKHHFNSILAFNNWGFSTFCQILFKLVFQKKTYGSKLLIQYVPHTYSRYSGINLFLPLMLVLLRFLSPEHKIHLFIHELWHPNNNHPKEKVLHYLHKIMITISSLTASKCFFSCSHFYKMLNESAPVIKDKSYLLFVPSNIKNFDYVGQRVKIVHFGSDHLSKQVPELLAGLEKLNKKYDFEVEFIGLERPGYCPENSSFKFLGRLDDKQVSDKLNESRYLLAYFSDGVSTRRGSVMGALAHGVNVLSAKSFTSDEKLINGPLYLSHDNMDSFIELIENTILINKSSYDSQEIQKFYSQNFEWKTLITEITNEVRG